jgi:hypothetical protein
MTPRLRIVQAALLLAATLAIAPAAHAFGLSGIGGRLGWTNPEDLGDGFTIGGHLEFERPDSRFHLMPSVLYFNGDEDVNGLSANADVFYHFGNNFVTTPYLGAGLGLFHTEVGDDGNTNLGANVFGGMRFPGPGANYYIEGRYAMADPSAFSLLGGATFHFGGGGY